MATEPMIKGAAIRAFFAWYQERFGVERVRLIASRMPDDLRALVDPDEPLLLLSGSWYPARLVHAMFDAVAESSSPHEVERLVKEAAREVVRDGTNGVYRALLKTLVSPEIYARLIPRLWRQLNSTGDRSMTMLGSGKAESRIANWPGHHPVLCALTNELMCAIFETMGCRGVRWERVSCISRDGGTACVSRVTWAAR
jgi:hypothetical protein